MIISDTVKKQGIHGNFPHIGERWAPQDPKPNWLIVTKLTSSDGNEKDPSPILKKFP